MEDTPAYTTGQEPELGKLDKLASDLLEAKKLEAQAKKHRIAVEEQIVMLVGSPDEGQRTHESDFFKVTVKGGVSRKADFKAMRELEGIGENLLPIKQNDELDLEGLRWLEANMPEVHTKLLTVITTTPRKTAVTVKEVA